MASNEDLRQKTSDQHFKTELRSIKYLAQKNPAGRTDIRLQQSQVYVFGILKHCSILLVALLEKKRSQFEVLYFAAFNGTTAGSFQILSRLWTHADFWYWITVIQ